MLSAVLGLVIALLVAAGMLRVGPPAGPVRKVSRWVRRSGLLPWGYGPAALAVLALALLGHGAGAMLVAGVGLLVLVSLLSAAFLVRQAKADG